MIEIIVLTAPLWAIALPCIFLHISGSDKKESLMSRRKNKVTY